MNSRFSRRAGHDQLSWPVVALLLGAVLVPTAGVLWFMGQAMGNERLAVRQKLDDAYRAQLRGLQQDLQETWRARMTTLDSLAGEVPSNAFAIGIGAIIGADSMVIFDSEGQPGYPAPARFEPTDTAVDGDWRRAQALESSARPEEAAAVYRSIAEGEGDVDLAARARLAEARCLVRAERVADAISVLVDELGQSRYAGAVGPQGRLIAPNAQLRALQLIDDREEARFKGLVESLSKRLRDYGEPALPATQRLFLMKQLQRLVADLPPFETLTAEELATRYLESDPPAAVATSFRPSGLNEVWQLASTDGQTVALYDEKSLLQDFQRLLESRELPASASVQLRPPGAETEDLFVVLLPAGGFFDDWQLVLRPDDQTLFAAAANQRINAYLLTGASVVLVILFVAILVARILSQQMRLTRLKNDLLATVSHELKTPLASMRLLVDTLLETGTDDEKRLREYLAMIAQENSRLSRLVDNFLTFSKMQQGRFQFDMRDVLPDQVIEAASASATDRFRAEGCHFVTQTTPDLPPIRADFDALVTVLINLLDNAFKYSTDEKHIELDGFRRNGHICFAVKDNGIGLSSRQASRIFDRFYQVDQSLSRDGSGCGLGLSIVQQIVSAHGGSIEVDSTPGEGSTFTVILPAQKIQGGLTHGR